MFDINFYMQSYALIKEIDNGKEFSKLELYNYFEKIRSKDPIVYNIETTNACNMRCKMCPRTSRMTRKISFLETDYYEGVIKQLKPHDKKLWSKWEQFCIDNYGISSIDGPSENHFFLYVIPKVIQLHGYGDPLLDKNIGKVVDILTKNNLESYFSCTPANIEVMKTIEMMELGLGYLKYSYESTDDAKFKEIRGNAANFQEAYDKTIQVLNEKEKRGLSTEIIITMIDIGHDQKQQEEFAQLSEAFKGLDVYVYLKSEDQQWYRKDETLKDYLQSNKRDLPSQEDDYYGTNSIHWQEFCKHPWMSMSIKSDGEVHMCMEDYNNEIFLGNSYENSLSEIWNGDLYDKFRKDHFDLTPCIKCTEECDMSLVGNKLNNRTKLEILSS